MWKKKLHALLMEVLHQHTVMLHIASISVPGWSRVFIKKKKGIK